MSPGPAMTRKPLRVSLVGGSIRCERELSGSERVPECASENFNFAIALLQACVESDPVLKESVEVTRINLDIIRDQKEPGPADVKVVAETRPDVLGLSCYCWNLDILLELASMLPQLCSGVFTILGGPSVALDASSLLGNYKFIDAAAQGEGEITFVELLRALVEDRELDSVPGLVFRKNIPEGESLIVENPAAPLVELSALPSPYRMGLLDSEIGHSIVLETSRGGRGARRYFPVESIASDLRWALERGVRIVKFADTALNYHDERVSELATMVRRIDPEKILRFKYFLKHELLTREQVTHLRALPADEVVVDVVSVNPAVREALGKRPINRRDLEEKILWLRDVGPVTGAIVLGLPCDSLEGLKQTIDWLLEVEQRNPGALAQICLSWLALFPGSKLYSQRDRYRFRVMKCGTPYLLESVEHSHDDLLVMARAAAEKHYCHPSLRLEYFHRVYLLQDAAERHRYPRIERVTDDERPVVALVGGPIQVAGQRFPFSLSTAFIKAYVEKDERLRRAFRLELVHLEESRAGDPKVLGALEDLGSLVIIWWRPPVMASDFRRRIYDLRARNRDREPLIVVGGVERGSPVHILQSVPHVDAVVLGEGEGPISDFLRKLTQTRFSFKDLEGLAHRQGGKGTIDAGVEGPVLQSLDSLPSPYQWGYLPARSQGGEMAMLLGRKRIFGTLRFAAERLEADVRWALEEGYKRLFWSGVPLPDQAEAVLELNECFRRADPGSRMLHVFELSQEMWDHLDNKVLRAMSTLPPFALYLPEGTEPSARVEKQLRELRQLELWRTNEPAKSALSRIEAVCLAWRERGGISGWVLKEINSHQGVLSLHCWTTSGSTATVEIRQKNKQFEVVLSKKNAPESECEKVLTLVRRLVGRASRVSNS